MSAGSDGLMTVKFTSNEIAELTVAEIHSMTKEDLIQVIVTGRIPFVDETRLETQDLETLRRLAFLARNCCQNQVL